MIGVTFKTDAMHRALEEYVRKAHDMAQAALTDATRAAEASARATIHATTVRRTGELEDSWSSSWRGPYTRGLTNWSGHAGFINSGTRPHVIAARRVQFLRFQMNGQTMFRRSVNHPGTKARPFVALAMASGQMALKASAQTGVERLAREF